MDLMLKDKVVFVAASSKGLGYASAMQMASEGAKVLIGSRNESTVQQAAETIQKESGSSCLGLRLDMRQSSSIRRWVSEGSEALGKIDALLVNAGGPPPGSFFDFSDEDWEEAFELTLLSAIRLIRESLDHFNPEGGAILTITSSSIKEPIENLILSNVMRSGVVSLVKSLSRELAPRKIRINNIIPGFFHTDRLKQLDRSSAETEDLPVEVVQERRMRSIPLRRYGVPEEFGRAAGFLLSPAASYVNGNSFTIDGGAMHTVW